MDHEHGHGWSCPDDGAVLHAVAGGDAEASSRLDEHSCGHCQGSWLPGTLVATRITVPSAQRLTEVGRRSTRCCPLDGSALWAVDHHDIEIDICASCGGIWLDAGEREKLLAERDETSGDTGDASVDSDTMESVGETLEAVFDFLGNVFSDW